MSRPDIEAYFSGLHEVEKIKFVEDFIAREHNASVPTLDLVNADYIAKNRSGVLLFYAPNCTHCHNFAPTFANVAKQLGDQVFFGTVNCYDHIHKNNILSEFLKIGGVPAIKFVHKGKFIDYNGGKDFKVMLANICKQYGICNYVPDVAKYVEPESLKFMGKTDTDKYYHAISDGNEVSKPIKSGGAKKKKSKKPMSKVAALKKKKSKTSSKK